MQTESPAANLMQRLLQSDKIRNQYSMELEVDNGCSKIVLCHLVNTNDKMALDPNQRTVSPTRRNYFH